MEKILIIDDDIELTNLVDEFLSSKKYKIISKHTPKDGLDYLQKIEVDCITI